MIAARWYSSGARVEYAELKFELLPDPVVDGAYDCFLGPAFVIGGSVRRLTEPSFWLQILCRHVRHAHP